MEFVEQGKEVAEDEDEGGFREVPVEAASIDEEVEDEVTAAKFYVMEGGAQGAMPAVE